MVATSLRLGAIARRRLETMLLTRALAAMGPSLVLTACGEDCQCSRQSGIVELDADVAVCPELSGIDAAPLTVFVGGEIELRAMYAGPDGIELELQWSAETGAFDDPSVGETRFHCEEAGEVSLEFSVSTDSCTESRSVLVECVERTTDTSEADAVRTPRQR